MEIEKLFSNEENNSKTISELKMNIGKTYARLNDVKKA